MVKYYKVPKDKLEEIIDKIIKRFSMESFAYQRIENIGGIGFIIAHEISHAFDNNGSKFDENGLLNNWYTESSNKKYNEIQSKVIEYYDKYEVIYNISNNGKRTIGENIADLGAMNV